MTAGRKSDDFRVVQVETSFERKTRQPGGLGRADAVAAAEKSILEMRSSIEKTIDEKMAELETAFSNAGASGGSLDAQLRVMLELATVLRDLGGVVGFNLMTYVSESLCKFLYLFESRGGFEKAVVDCHLKAIRLVRNENFRMLQPADVPQLQAGFADMFRKTAALHSY